MRFDFACATRSNKRQRGAHTPRTIICARMAVAAHVAIVKCPTISTSLMIFLDPWPKEISLELGGRSPRRRSTLTVVTGGTATETPIASTSNTRSRFFALAFERRLSRLGSACVAQRAARRLDRGVEIRFGV